VYQSVVQEGLAKISSSAMFLARSQGMAGERFAEDIEN